MIKKLIICCLLVKSNAIKGIILLNKYVKFDSFNFFTFLTSIVFIILFVLDIYLINKINMKKDSIIIINKITNNGCLNKFLEKSQYCTNNIMYKGIYELINIIVVYIAVNILLLSYFRYFLFSFSNCFKLFLGVGNSSGIVPSCLFNCFSNYFSNFIMSITSFLFSINFISF